MDFSKQIRFLINNDGLVDFNSIQTLPRFFTLNNVDNRKNFEQTVTYLNWLLWDMSSLVDKESRSHIS